MLHALYLVHGIRRWCDSFKHLTTNPRCSTPFTFWVLRCKRWPKSILGQPSSAYLTSSSEELLPPTFASDSEDDEVVLEEVLDEPQEELDNPATGDGGSAETSGADGGVHSLADARVTFALGAAFLFSNASCTISAAGAPRNMERHWTALSPGTAFAGQRSNTD